MRRGKLPAINSNFDAGLGFCRCFNVCFLDRAVTINKELLCERFIKTYKLCICVCVCVSSLFPLLCSKIALITYLSLLISMLLLQYKGTLAMPDTDTSILKLWWVWVENGELSAPPKILRSALRIDINYLNLNTQSVFALSSTALMTVIKKTMQRLWIMSFNFVQLLPVKNQICLWWS